MTHEPTAREAISEVLASYCRGIDRGDRALVARCFHPDASDDHGTGPRGVDDFLDWCFQLLDGYDSTFHFLGQSTFEFHGDDQAWVETYGIAMHRRAGGPDSRNLTTGFRYLDVVTRREGRWRIAERRAITDWSRVESADSWWPIPDGMPKGARGTDDPSAPR